MEERLLFIQAEDGIRDLVRSRGLGDVYKRQLQPAARTRIPRDARRNSGARERSKCVVDEAMSFSVSYTHLTLPTSDLV
mgnify:CR=1 FL=1